MHTMERKIGKNRGNRRIWLEGKSLAVAGWNKGDRYDRVIANGQICLMKHPTGARKVAGTTDRPIIDLAGKWVTEWAATSDRVAVHVQTGTIVVETL